MPTLIPCASATDQSEVLTPLGTCACRLGERVEREIECDAAGFTHERREAAVALVRDLLEGWAS
jgi:hypothetical protein